MKYYKNTELAKLYHVSEKSVRNWIQSAQESKLELQLYKEGGRLYVANTSKNTALIEKLVQKNKKYKNTRGLKNITPTKEFYKTYDRKQILDIISNTIIHREIPREYCYFDGGAYAWDEFTTRLSAESEGNILNSTLSMLEAAKENIDQLLVDSRKINVVDLGPGNGLPIRPTLERLVKQSRLKRYIAIDISPEMLSILEKNIKSWFGDKVAFEGHIRDISYERFDDLFADDYADDDANVPANLVFFMGGTLSNFRSPNQVLQAINSSLGLKDIFVHTGYLDTPKTRRYFDFNVAGTKLKVPPKNRIILDLLNVDESLYDAEQLFDKKERARTISIRPKVDLSLTFELANGVRHVELRKNEPILLWRHRHYSIVDMINLFDENGFDLLRATKSKDQQYGLLVSKIKTNDLGLF